MFDTLVLAISIAVFLYVGYRLLRAYKPSWFQSSTRPVEAFAPRPPPTGPPVATRVNTPPAPVPAPAPPIAQPPPEEPRVVAPGGPNAPSATPLPNTPPKISPEAAPVDPYDDKNMEAPIGDSMRFPEMSFGPGPDNKGTGRVAPSGTGSGKALSSETPFSPEFAQNGGLFMNSVTANDLSHDDSYASA